MLQLYSYLDKITEIQWYFNESDLNDLESLLFVKFEKENDYYTIKEIKYTYIDILCGIEDMSFELTKKNNVIKIKILKI